METLESRQLLAVGDIAIFSEVGGGDAIGQGTSLTHDFDTAVRNAGSAYSFAPGAGATDITINDAGHHLVLYSSRFDSTGGANRSEFNSHLNLGGTDLAAGWSQGYIRRANFADEAITSGGAIINATAGQVLQLQTDRTDNNGTAAERLGGNTGIQLLQLDDSWDYLSLSQSTDIAGTPNSTTFVDVTYDTQNEITAGFAHTSGSGDISLVDGGHYLVLANTHLTGANNRGATIQRLTLDGAEVNGSSTTVYRRGTNSTEDGAAAIGMILEATPGQTLSVEVSKDFANNVDPTIKGGQSAVTIVRLPDYADYVRLEDSTAQDFNEDDPLNWDTQLEIDAAFTHDTTTDNSRISVNTSGDYLFFASLYDDMNSANVRQVFGQQWSVNGGAPLSYAQTARYSRSDGPGLGSNDGSDDQEAVGNWSGAIFPGLQPGDYIEASSQQLAAGGVLSADSNGIQGVRIFSLFRAGDDTGATDEDTVLTTVDPGGAETNLFANDNILDDLVSFDNTSGQGATVQVNSDGTFSYDPTAASNLQGLAAGESVVDTFSYSVTNRLALPPTPGVDFYVDATSDNDGNSRWEDLVPGNPSGFDFELDDSPAVARVTGTSSLPGIAAAYDFPGGSTGNEAGALLSDSGTATRRSFQNAPGDWSNNENVSIEIWFKPDNLTPTPTNGQILFEDGGGTGLGFYVDDNELRLRKQPNGGNVAYDLSTDPSGLLTGPATSEFIQAVGVFDASGSIELFVNGTSVGTASVAGNDWTGGDAAGVGTRGAANTGGIGGGQSNTESFDGQISIFGVYRDQMLTPEQVMSNFDAIVTPPPTSTATVSVAITGVNDAPSAANDSATTTEETSTTGNVLTNDSDLESTVIAANLNYDAGDDDGANATWENTGSTGGFDITALSGETHTLTPTTNLPGITGAYDFDGSGSGGNLTSLNNQANGSDVSFEIWFRPADLTGDEILFESGGGNGVGIYLGGGTNGAFSGVSDSEVIFSVTQNSLGTQTAFVAADLSGVDINEFVQVVGTFDISADISSIYVNGSPVATSAPAVANIGDWSGGDAAGVGRIGGSNAGGVAGGAQGYSNFDGEVSIFRVYTNRLLSPSEVSNNFRAISDPIVVSEVNGNGPAVGNQTILPSGALLTLNADGTFDYDPNGQFENLAVGQIGTDSFSYTITDDQGATDSATVTISITGENDAPTANDDMLAEAATDEDTAITIPMANNESASYATAVLAQAPIGFWALNETSGTLADNQGTAGDPLDGTYQANVTQGVTGFDADGDLAVQLNNATDSFINIDNYQGVTGTSPRTVSAWINTTEADAAFTSWGTNAGGQKWTFRVQSGNGQAGAIRLEVNGGYIVGNTVVNDGQWHHVAFTFADDGTPNVNDVKLFVDGQLDAEVGGAVAPSAVLARAVNTASVADVRIGLDFGNRALGGMIDDVALFDRALSDAEIADQFNATLPNSSILDNDTDPDGDALAVQSFDTVSVGGASVSIDVLQTIGVVGTLGDTLTFTPQTISFGRDFINPVVIAQPLDSDGGDEAVARITSVDAVNDEFTVFVQETPEHPDPNHTPETLFYVVLEAGLWQLPDGTLLEIGTLDSNSVAPTFETVTFGSNFSSTPAVLTQVQTNNDPDYVTTRQNNTSAMGFDVALEEHEAADDVHGVETIGYVAISQGSGMLPGGVRYEAVTTGLVVDQNPTTVNFAQSYDSPPLVVAALASYAGPDPTHLRFDNLTNSSVQFEAEEDTSADTELNHAAESVSYLAFAVAGEFQAIPQGSPVGTFTYDPSGALDSLTEGEVLTDTFTYTVADPSGATSTATVSVVVTGVNDTPTAAIMGVPETDPAPIEGVVSLPVDFSFLASDPDESIGFTFEIDWGDGTMPGTFTDVEVANGTSPQALSHVFASQGTYTISVRATDSEGATSTVVTHDIDIVPVAVVGNDLVAGGTPSSDRIIFYPSQGGVRVRYNNVTYPLDGGAYSFSGSIIANGEDGSDQIIMAQGITSPAVIDGGEGNDYLAGSIANDTVTGGTGNDVILLGEGDNFADGQEGNDRLEGRSGVDVLFGGAGNDRLNGGAGNDILDGGADNDFIHGATGNDLLLGRSGVDTLSGHYGDDVAFGGDDADQIFGGAGQDLLTGGSAIDRVRGDGGDDNVVGGTVDSEAATMAALDAMMAALGTNTLPADPAGMYGSAANGIDDGVVDDLTGGSGVDTFHSSSDSVRDFRDGDGDIVL